MTTRPAIIGSGNIGSALARLFARAGCRGEHRQHPRAAVAAVVRQPACTP